MTEKGPFGFDPGEMAALVEELDFARIFREAGLEGEAQAEAQRRNLTALQAISRSVSARYQRDFRAALTGFRVALAAAEDSPEEAGKAVVEALEALGREASDSRNEALEAMAEEVAMVLEAMKGASGDDKL